MLKTLKYESYLSMKIDHTFKYDFNDKKIQESYLSLSLTFLCMSHT